MQSWDAGRYSRDFTTLLTYLITFAESSIWVLWPVHSRSLYNEMKMSIPYNFNLSFTVKIHYIFKFSHIIFQLVYSFQSLVGILKKSFTALQVCKQSSAIVCGKNKNKAKKKKKQPTNYSQGKINKVLCYWRLPFILQNKKAENRRSFNLVSCFDKWLPCGVSFTNNLSFTFNLAI